MPLDASTPSLHKLRRFVRDMTEMVGEPGLPESEVLSRGKGLLSGLIREDDWLPDAFAQPHPQYYTQYLLHCDPLERFSVVSFVWGPGQMTPIHDHMTWGLIGMLRGAEEGERYDPGTPPVFVGKDRLEPGMVEMVSPAIGDIHRVKNAFDDRVSISIHVYGGNVGAIRRHVFDAQTGTTKEFISGYSNAVLPNLWQGAA